MKWSISDSTTGFGGSGVFLEEKKIYGRDAKPVVVPRHLAMDIDTPEDWEMAERLFKAL